MKRQSYWDSLKFFLIFLVVYAHVVSPYKSDSQFNMAVYNFIYLFHMPLFIFISGRFSHIHNKHTYRHRTWQLLETYILFQVFGIAILFLDGKSPTTSYFIKPYWISWYLLVLFYYRLMVYFIPKKWLEYHKTIIFLSICISLAIGYIPFKYYFGIHRALCFLPFFVLGYYSTEISLRKLTDRISYVTVAVTLIAIFIINAITMKDVYAFVLHCPYMDWASFHLFTSGAFPAIRIMFIFIAIVISLMVMRIAPSHPRFAEWGTHTLFIYIYHAPALILLFSLINKNYLPENEWLLFIYAFLITTGLLFLTRFKFLYILLNPFTYYRLSRSRTKDQSTKPPNTENLNNQ